MPDIIQLPVPNEQLVKPVVERLREVLELVSDGIALAALADVVGDISNRYEEQAGLTDALLRFVSERAWGQAHGGYVMIKPKDNVTPLTPRDTNPDEEN